VIRVTIGCYGRGRGSIFELIVLLFGSRAALQERTSGIVGIRLLLQHKSVMQEKLKIIMLEDMKRTHG
jgi:hypothetical protein